METSMRISLALVTALIGGGFTAPLPAAAQDLRVVQRAWSACNAQQVAADVRFSACDTVVASDGVKADFRARALVGRGFARIMQGDRAGAMADLDASIRLSPTALAYSYRGSLRISRQEYDAAVSDYDRAIELEPRNPEYYRMRGQAHSERKDYRRSIADKTAVIELSAEPRAANYLLRAIEYERAEQYDKAIADYQKALEIDPDDSYARRFLAGLGGTPPESASLPPGPCSGEVATTSHHDRIKGCTDLIESGTYSGWTLKTAYCNRAYALTELGEYDRVVADSDALLKINENASCAYQNRGRAWYYKKDLDRAIADYTRAIEIEPKFLEAFASRGTAYHDRFEFDLAVADYDTALRIEPDDKDVQAWRANSLRLKQVYADAIADTARQTSPRQSSSSRTSRAICTPARKSTISRAKRASPPLTARKPKSASSTAPGLCSSRRATPNPDRAAAPRQDFRWPDFRWPALEPQWSNTHMRDTRLTWRPALLAGALVLAGWSGAAAQTAQPDEQQKIPAWEACIKTHNSGAERLAACTTVIDGQLVSGRKLAGAYCIRGHELTEKRELDAALKDLDTAIATDPTYACAFNNRGRVYKFKRDYDRAIADYSEAIRLEPTMAMAWNNRGDSWLLKGDYDRAIADLGEAIRINPSYALAYGNRGNAHSFKRDFANAIEDYNVQIRIAPNLMAYLSRGDAYRDTEQLDRAAADYGEVIRIAPNDARGWRNRGMIRLFQEKYKAGIADYDRALKYDAADADSWNNRGQAKMRVGDKKGAIADLRKALALHPGLQPATASLRKLGVEP
jgi:tetratricopeptide (TPR) repeat protein